MKELTAQENHPNRFEVSLEHHALPLEDVTESIELQAYAQVPETQGDNPDPENNTSEEVKMRIIAELS